MLKIDNLTKKYGSFKAIDNISFDVNKGEIVGFFGKNGAGKSTTIKSILDIINKSNGKVSFNKEEIKRNDIEIFKKIGYLPSEIYLYNDLTVDKTFKYFNSFYTIDCSNKISDLVKKLDIDINKKVRDLSLGNLKKVGIVLAIMHNPDLILMDEAISGLDPLVQERFYEILKEEKKRGATILYSSHNLSEIHRICDRVIIIKDGLIIKNEDVSKLNYKNMLKIYIKSNDIDKITSKLKVKLNNNRFNYSGDINNLLNILKDYKIDELLIEEPPIEETFLHYYEGDDNNV